MNPALHKLRPPRRHRDPHPRFANDPGNGFFPRSKPHAMSKPSAHSPPDPARNIRSLSPAEHIITDASDWIESLNPSHKSRMVARCACAS